MAKNRSVGQAKGSIRPLRQVLTAFVFALLVPLPAHAIDSTVSTLIDIVINAADPSLAPAKPLIVCAIDHPGNPLPCMESEAVKQAKQQAGGLIPFNVNDKRIQLVVNVVKDVRDKNWPKAVADGGPVVVQTVACAILPLAGPTKGPACSVIGYVITHNATLIKDVISALGNGPDWWKLVDLLGKDAVCMLVPDQVGVLKDIGCGVLGDILETAKDGLDAAYKGGKALWYGAGDALGLNDPKAMPQETYYNLYWQPWYHYATSLCLTNSCKGLGNLDSHIWHPCKNYFADHDMTTSTAQKACDAMRDKKFNPQVKQFAEAMKVATDVYVENMRPWAKTWAVEDYGKDTLTLRRNFIQQNAAVWLRSKFPFPEPQPARCESIKQSPLYKNNMYKSLFDKLYNQCQSDIKQQMPSPTAWNHMGSLAAQKFMPIFNAEKKALEQKLPKLVSGGCYPPSGWSASEGIKLVCDSYPGYQACLSTLSAGAEKQHCSVDQAKIDKNLVKQLVAALGTKRCQAKGTTVLCSRPWKQQKCEKLRNQLAGGEPTKVLCHMGPPIAVVAFKFGEKEAKDILFILNGGVNKPTGMKTENGQGLNLYLPPTKDSCKTTWDPLSIVCKDIKTLPKVSGHPNFKYCPHAKNDDGADVPCLVMTLAMQRNAMVQQGVASQGVFLPSGGIAKQNSTRGMLQRGKPRLNSGVAPNRGQSAGAGLRTSPQTARGGFATSKPRAKMTGRIATITRPHPVIINSRAHVESGCRAPQPALTISVTVKNTGGPLGANQGEIHVQEIGGTHLDSWPVLLPALGTNQTSPALRIPVSTSQPYNTLAGKHQLQLILTPRGNSFDLPKGRPHSLVVVFPNTYCQPQRRLSLPAKRSETGDVVRTVPVLKRH